MLCATLLGPNGQWQTVDRYSPEAGAIAQMREATSLVPCQGSLLPGIWPDCRKVRLRLRCEFVERRHFCIFHFDRDEEKQKGRTKRRKRKRQPHSSDVHGQSLYSVLLYHRIVLTPASRSMSLLCDLSVSRRVHACMNITAARTTDGVCLFLSHDVRYDIQ